MRGEEMRGEKSEKREKQRGERERERERAHKEDILRILTRADHSRNIELQKLQTLHKSKQTLPLFPPYILHSISFSFLRLSFEDSACSSRVFSRKYSSHLSVCFWDLILGERHTGASLLRRSLRATFCLSRRDSPLSTTSAEHTRSDLDIFGLKTPRFPQRRYDSHHQSWLIHPEFSVVLGQWGRR